MRQSRFLLSWIFFVYGGDLFARSLFFPLPYDETEANAMINEGVLDSNTWKAVRPFYEHPILVPAGELGILVDLFPNNFPSLPISPRELSIYEPWKEADERRFFKDFPELENYSPILSFETIRDPYHARIGCSLYKYTKPEPGVATDFMTSPDAKIGIDGRIGFDTSFARWQRRKATLRTARAGNVSLGNYNLNLDRGLFYGYFPESASDTDAAENWRYAESNTWNGMLYESPESGHVTAAAFYHKRRIEEAYGARFGLSLIGRLHILAGVSRLIVPDAERKNYSYAHAEVGYRGASWNFGIIGGREQSKADAIPFIAYARHSANKTDSSGNAGIDVMYANLPAGCIALRSALYHECAGKTDKNDSARVNRSVLKTECRIPLCARVKSACGASFYHSPAGSAFDGYVSFSGTLWLRYSIRYAFRPVVDDSSQYHCIVLSLAKPVSRPLEMRLYCRYTDKDDSYQSVLIRLTAAITAMPSMELAPYASMYGTNTGNRELSLGLSQILRLFEKTWGDLKLEIPIVNNYRDRWLLNARAHFYL